MSNDDLYLGYLIRRLHQRSSAVFAEEISKAGLDLTPMQFAALVEIKKQKQADQARLAERVGCDRATMGGIIERLEKKGYLERQIDPNDRRARLVCMSDSGNKLLESAEPLVRSLQKRIVEPLDKKECAELERLLSKALSKKIC